MDLYLITGIAMCFTGGRLLVVGIVELKKKHIGNGLNYLLLSILLTVLGTIALYH